MEELISVIVPIYNVYDYLEKCINSIIHQTYSNLEIILIDDGSDDGCSLICDEYKKLDNRIKVIHKKNEGLSSARNTGLDIATGSLINFVDSDDYLELNMLEELKNNMDKYHSDISICDFYYIKNNRRREHNYLDREFIVDGKNKFVYLENEYGLLTIYAWNKLYKRELFNSIRYPKGKIYEDSYIICDLLDKAKAVSYLIKPLYNYVYRKNSIVNTFSLNHFDKITSSNRKITFYNKKEYYDLEKKELNKKHNIITYNLAKMKTYGIDNKDTWNHYYNELVATSNSIKWKDSNKYTKRFKVLGKNYITFKSLEYYIYYKMNGRL